MVDMNNLMPLLYTYSVFVIRKVGSLFYSLQWKVFNFVRHGIMFSISLYRGNLCAGLLTVEVCTAVRSPAANPNELRFLRPTLVRISKLFGLAGLSASTS